MWSKAGGARAAVCMVEKIGGPALLVLGGTTENGRALSFGGFFFWRKREKTGLLFWSDRAVCDSLSSVYDCLLLVHGIEY